MARLFEVAGPSDEMYTAAAALVDHANDDAMKYGSDKRKFEEVRDLTVRFCRADLSAANDDPGAGEYLAARESTPKGGETPSTTAGHKFREVNAAAVSGIVAALSLPGRTNISKETVHAFGEALDAELLAVRGSQGEIDDQAAFERGVSALTARRLWQLVHSVDGLQDYAALMSDRKR